MSVALRARKPLALLTAGLAITAGLALSPIGVGAASASTSSSSSILSKIQSLRASNEVAPLKTNAFLTAYAKGYSDYAAKHSTVNVNQSKLTKHVPDNPQAPTGGIIPTVKVPHGSATSVYSFIKKNFASDLTDGTHNYVGIGYTKKGTTVYAAVVLLDYTTAPYDLISESKPTISGTAKVGATLTAKPHFSPTADTLSYTWKSGSTVLGSGATYVLQPTDLAKKITLTVKGSKSGYVGSDDTTTLLTSTSSSTKAVAHGTITKGVVEVEGSRFVGSTLTATPDGWAPASATFSYKWVRDGKTIKGAAAVNTYTQVAADKGHKINVVVSVKATGYTSTSKTTTSKTKTEAPKP